MARILLVHGDQLALDALHSALTHLGHACDGTTSPVLALETAIAFPPDLIVVGDHVPPMDGPTLQQLIRCFLGSKCPPIVFAPRATHEGFLAEISTALPTAIVFGSRVEPVKTAA